MLLTLCSIITPSGGKPTSTRTSITTHMLIWFLWDRSKNMVSHISIILALSWSSSLTDSTQYKWEKTPQKWGNTVWTGGDSEKEWDMLSSHREYFSFALKKKKKITYQKELLATQSKPRISLDLGKQYRTTSYFQNIQLFQSGSYCIPIMLMAKPRHWSHLSKVWVNCRVYSKPCSAFPLSTAPLSTYSITFARRQQVVVQPQWQVSPKKGFTLYRW